MTEHTDVFESIAAIRIIPMLSVENPEDALPLADALLAGGLPVAEITFRTAAAADVMERIATKRPELLLGAGTVLTTANVRRAKDAGARFAVSPGLNAKVVREAMAVGLPFAPGVMTPSDIEAALDLGLRVLKFFPAGPVGGLKTIKSIAAPYTHTGLRFIPTGGVSQDNLRDYLSNPVILAVGGSWIAKKDAIAAGDWAQISEHCKQAVEAASSLQG